MIDRRGFRIAETPCATSGSARVRLPFLGGNHPPRITLPWQERAPPGTDKSAGQPEQIPAPDMALGQRRAPPAQANQSPPESTTERSQL
jgi:hypothetical protein